jgi:hypothetical protein
MFPKRKWSTDQEALFVDAGVSPEILTLAGPERNYKGFKPFPALKPLYHTLHLVTGI